MQSTRAVRPRSTRSRMLLTLGSIAAAGVLACTLAILPATGTAAGPTSPFQAAVSPSAPAPSVLPATQSQRTPRRQGGMLFVENVGQFDAGARFKALGGGPGTLHLAQDGLWLTVLEQPALPRQGAGVLRAAGDPLQAPDATRSLGDQPRHGTHLRLRYSGANPAPRVEGFDRQQTVVSYFQGNDPSRWRPNVPVWGGVRYVDLFPGVDLEIYGEAGQLRQRFILRHHERGEVINSRSLGFDTTLEVAGGVGLRLDEASGHAVITTTAGEVGVALATLHGESMKPLASGTNARMTASGVTHPFTHSSRVLQASGVLQAGTGAVRTSGSSDLLLGTFLGTSSDDQGAAVAVDASGNMFVTGWTVSTAFPTTTGAFSTTNAGGSVDSFVTKLDPTGGSVVYSTYLGGNQLDYAFGLALDSGGSAYVAGWTSSSDFPSTPSAFDRTYGTSDDAFVLKLDPTGTNLSYGTFLGGSTGDYALAIAVDLTGSAYVAGLTSSVDFPTTIGAFDPTQNGDFDAFIARVPRRVQVCRTPHLWEVRVSMTPGL